MTLDSFFPSDRTNSEITMNTSNKNNPLNSDVSSGEKVSELRDERNHTWAVLNPEDGLYYVTKAWIAENQKYLHKLFMRKYVTAQGEPRGFSFSLESSDSNKMNTTNIQSVQSGESDGAKMPEQLVMRICRKCGAQREIPVSQTHCGYLGCESTKLAHGETEEEKFVMNGLGDIELDGADDGNLVGQRIQKMIDAAENPDAGTLPLIAKDCNFNCGHNPMWVTNEDGKRVQINGPDSKCRNALEGLPHDGYAYKPLLKADGTQRMNPLTGEPVYVKDLEIDMAAAMKDSQLPLSVQLYRENKKKKALFAMEMEDENEDEEKVDFDLQKTINILWAFQPTEKEPLYKDTAGVWKVETWKKKFGDEVPYPQNMSYKEVSLCLVVISSHKLGKPAYGLVDKSLRGQQAHDEAIQLLKNDKSFMKRAKKQAQSAQYNAESKDMAGGYKPRHVMPESETFGGRYNPEEAIHKMEMFLEMQAQEQGDENCHNLGCIGDESIVDGHRVDGKWKGCDYLINCFVNRKTNELVEYPDVKAFNRMFAHDIMLTQIQPKTDEELIFTNADGKLREIETVNPEKNPDSVVLTPRGPRGFPLSYTEEYPKTETEKTEPWTQIQDILMAHHQKEHTTTYYCFICNKRHSKVIVH